jgi:hypothetical protein
LSTARQQKAAGWCSKNSQGVNAVKIMNDIGEKFLKKGGEYKVSAKMIVIVVRATDLQVRTI